MKGRSGGLSVYCDKNPYPDGNPHFPYGQSTDYGGPVILRARLADERSK